MKKFDIKLVLVAFAALALSFAVIALLNGNLSTSALGKKPVTPGGGAGAGGNNARASVVISTSWIDQSTVGLYLSTKKPQSLSAYSIKLQYPYDGVMDYTSMSFTPNPDLVGSGWSFPVKTVSLDGGTISIEVAGVDVSTIGYSLDGKLEIGRINFAGTVAKSLTFSVDSSQTKVLAKDASSIGYSFVSQ